MEGTRCYRAVTGMPFAGADGDKRLFEERLYGFQAAYYRVRYPDGHWEKHSHHDVTSGAARCRNTQGTG